MSVIGFTTDNGQTQIKYDYTMLDNLPNIPSVDSTLTQSGQAADAGAVGEVFGEISEELDDTDVTVNVPLDTSDLREGKRTAEGVGTSMNVNASNFTSCYIRVFTCEANKTYTLTITNGSTPASIAERATVVVSTLETSGATILWEKKTTNTANAKDVVEFTPTVAGYVYFNLDKNFQSIAVTTTGTQTVRTAKDAVARGDISDLQTAVGALDGLPEDVEALSASVEGFESTLEDVTEEYQDGTVETPVVLDTSDLREGKRSNEAVGSGMGFTNSSVTSCYARVFTCEANKTYTLTITNGSTPASIAERATVVIATGTTNLTCAWVKHTTNTSNAKDVVEFTPTVAGYVFFNLDKNFQSIAVTVREPNVVDSAVDVKSRNTIENVSKYVLNGMVEKAITWESGTFDANLEDTSGEGYRSNVISGVSGCAVCIKVDPSYAFVYGDGTNALMTVYGIYVIHPKTDTIRIGLSDTASNVGFEMRIYKERGLKGKYDVIVAASDSMPEDKAKADIVCDGTNDELDLQFAVNWNFGRKRRSNYNDACNVFLMPGTYNIDNFTQQYTANGQLTRETYAVMIGNIQPSGSTSYAYRVSIEGAYTSEHNKNDSGTVILVSSTGSATLSDEVLNALFGIALLATGTTGSIHTNGFSLDIQNLHICTGGVTNKVIGIDGYQAGNVIVKNCDIHAALSSMYMPVSTMETIPEGSIGIRAGRGSCLGVRQNIEGCRIQGFYEGIALCGEHFIIQDNLEIACVYAFTLNNYPANGAVQHPNVFIGNSIEQCLKMGKLLDAGMRDTLIYIGGSVENKITSQTPAVAMLPFEIASNTLLRGRIESDSLASPYNESFFYDGYGSTFEQTIYPYVQA